MTTKNTFEKALKDFAGIRNLHQVFTDFLTITLSAFCCNKALPLEMEAYARYSELEIKEKFPVILQLLMDEVASRKGDGNGNDVLGEFYEANFPKNEDNSILSWKDCLNTIQPIGPELKIISKHFPVSVLDVGCRSGRILLAMASKNKVRYEFLGVEYDFDFIMMTTLNLFLNFQNNSEVLWVDPNDNFSFKESYHIKILPMMVIRNLNSEKSKAWENYQIYRQSKRVLKQSKR